MHTQRTKRNQQQMRRYSTAWNLVGAQWHILAPKCGKDVRDGLTMAKRLSLLQHLPPRVVVHEMAAAGRFSCRLHATKHASMYFSMRASMRAR